VTAVTYLFIVQEIKETENKRKREIKLKKINKRKENQNKISGFKHTMTLRTYQVI